MMAAHRHPLIRLLAGASAAGALGLAGLVSAQSGAQVPATGTPTSATAPARPVFTDGQAQVVPAFADETQWIRACGSRPSSTRTATAVRTACTWT
jgi:hypothetical protein